MSPTVYLALPQRTALATACTLVEAMGLRSRPLEEGPSALGQLVEGLTLNPHSAALVDLSECPLGCRNVLALAQKIPVDLRRRVVLFRHDHGSVWASDREWVHTLGFAGLFAEVAPAALNLESAALPGLIAALVNVQIEDTRQLIRCLSAAWAEPDLQTHRGFIRAHCNRDAESLAQIMASGVRSIDRQYGVTNYPACFVGADAVRWLRNQFGCSAQTALEIGQALHALGLLHHVLDEHAFEDANLFYRLDVTANTTRTHLGYLYMQMQGPRGLEVADRGYMGKTYDHCWVAKDAVTWLSQMRQVPRYEAENLLNRLLGFGLIEHVLGEHRVKDQYLFFRFCGPGIAKGRTEKIQGASYLRPTTGLPNLVAGKL